MRSKILKLYALPLLALSLAVGACENIGGPDGLTGPEASEPSQSLLGLDLDAEDPNGYTVVKEKDASVGVVTGIIGSAGGKLVLGRHELRVPANAVSGATTFTMSKLSGELRFSLTATQLLPNDVGSQGFAVPVKLVANFQGVSEISDPWKLKIVWLKADGSAQDQPTDIDIVGKRAIGYLGHFSDYALVMP